MSTLSTCKRISTSALAAVLALISACSLPQQSLPDSTRTEAGPSPCQLVFDAGSSGTRLYIYAKKGDGWVEHEGPKSSALADPVRQIRGKRHQDLNAVTDELVSLLEAVRQEGPPKASGRPQWQAFDWRAACQVTDAMVLATAGMRIAEQENPKKSLELWNTVEKKLQAQLPRAKVKARTLTGFEEGLYAWLAVREQRSDSRFGIAEMGGASSQVAFPCATCESDDDAVRTVQVKGQSLRMYSYSFLGLGQDEAPKVLGLPPSCAYGIGTAQAGWKRSDCADRIDFAGSAGLRDPYNFPPAVAPAQGRGTSRDIPTGKAEVSAWVLTGAFNYMDSSALSTCCQTAGQCFEAPTSCFRAIYLDKYLEALKIPTNAPKADVSWTLGAALCAESGCLRQAAAPACRWSSSGCLKTSALP